MVISKNNLSRVEDFYRLAVTLGCMPEFAFIYRSGNGSDDWESKALSAQEKLAVLKLVKRLNEEYGMDAYLPKCTVRCPFSVDAEQMSVCIKTNGRIQPCQSLYGDAYSLGNAFDQRVGRGRGDQNMRAQSLLQKRIHAGFEIRTFSVCAKHEGMLFCGIHSILLSIFAQDGQYPYKHDHRRQRRAKHQAVAGGVDAAAPDPQTREKNFGQKSRRASDQ